MIIPKKLLNSVSIGIFSKTTDSALVEATGLSGLDFIILDAEHGVTNIETIQHHIRAAQLTSICSIVRVKDVNDGTIGSALDAGATGIQVPNIVSANQAKKVVDSARFYPYGNRGVCRFVRAAQYGNKERAEYFELANQALIILQVEGVEGVKNLDAILDVRGIDILFVGPYDLSQSVGKPGEIDSKEVRELMKEISLKAKNKGVVLGTFCDNPNDIQTLISEGFSYIAYSVDINIYLNACKNIKEFAHE